METSDLLGLLAMVGSVLLFLMVLLRISRVSKTRQSDQKLKRLLEIEEWATEVISCGFSDNMNQVKDIEQLRFNAIPKDTVTTRSDFDTTLAKTTTSEAEVVGSAYGVIEAVTRNRTADIADTSV